MKVLSGAVLFFALIGSNLQAFDHAAKEKEQPESWVISGFRDVAGELEVEKKFMAVPDSGLLEELVGLLPMLARLGIASFVVETFGFIGSGGEREGQHQQRCGGDALESYAHPPCLPEDLWLKQMHENANYSIRLASRNDGMAGHLGC
ncbi:MAG: hypothetical protein LAO30_07115 [Acidobacteriia bacterium]|nr:hypothetical protein [Terriglobia bacterium]